MWIELQKIIKFLLEYDELRQIVVLTLKMSLFSTVLSTSFGIIIGVVLAISPVNRKKKYICRLINTLMGMPPVVAGLIVFLILSRSGPLGELKLLYTLQAMVIAQVVLITPIVAGLSNPILEKKYFEIKETVRGLNISKIKQLYLLLHECKKPLIGILLSAFGRSIAEVGAVQLVGGNVQYKTRVMTTAIMLETNRGNFYFAVSLGVVLLLCSLIVNIVASIISD
ncbi:ABC-type tungstate transport system, permease protein [Lachnospiraceae bacterium TWA4]|nr:ABC-type tungstate transport system, permease protein [Lachnospiraceae bacterium TWA4]